MRLIFLAVLMLQLLSPAALGSDGDTHVMMSSVPQVSLPTYEWNNSSVETRGVVIALHGTTRHGTAFDTTARHLADLGFRVISLDLRGHGEWHFGPTASNAGRYVDYAKSSDDLADLLKQVKSQNPRIPVFCLGESIGSGVVIRTAAAHSDLMDGIVLVSPGSRPRVYNLFLVIRDFLKGITKLDRPLDLSGYIARYASEDRRIVDEMLDDPRSRNRLSGREILRTSWFLHGIPYQSRRVNKDMPVLLVQAEHDHIVGGYKRIWHRLQSRDKTLLRVPASGHVLLQTAFVKPAVLGSVSDWLSEHANSRARILAQTHPTLKAHALVPASEATH